MNLAQMIAEVRRGLDETTPDFWTDAEITDWLNEAVKVMTSSTQQLQAFYQFTTVSGTQEYALPSDLDELFNVVHFRSTLTPLSLTSPQAAQMGNQNPSIPGRFYLRSVAAQTAGQGTDGNITLGSIADPPVYSKILGLSPVPNQTGDTVTVFYFSEHFTMTELTDTSPIPVAFHRGPVSYAIAMGKQKEEAYGEMDRALQMFGQFTEKLQKKIINSGQEVAFPSVKMRGEEHYNFPTGVIIIPDGSAS